MANEITINASAVVRNGNLNFSWTPGALSVTQAAIGGPTPGMQAIGASEESIAFGELTVKGWVILQNLDATNYVRWGFSTGVYGGRLEPGEYAMFRLNPGATIFLIADTAACKVLAYGFED